MIRIKNLPLPLFSALFASAVVPASAQVELVIGTDKTYRQDNRGVQFRGGSFEIDAGDGDGIFQGGCARPAYWPPNIPLDPCPLGATGFLIFGAFDGASSSLGPYFSTIGVIPAIVIEPRRPDLVFLRAAPASKLPRPAAGFTDESFSIYYNLQSNAISEYIVTNYTLARDYDSTERSRFESEVVPGAYYYSFPRLRNPQLVSAITGLIHAMPEGYTKINNQNVGVRFTSVNQTRWTTDGFVEFNANRPNTVQWTGFSSSVVYPGVDRLFFSMRYLSDPADPKSDTDLTDPTGSPVSLFPSFVTGGDPRVVLPSPFTTTFTTPPIFDVGTTGVVEIELQRGLQNSGVSYEVSNRKFQIPIRVTDAFTDFVSTLTFPSGAKKGATDDADKDGFDNLTEWILGSSLVDAKSKPVAPVPKAVGTTSFGFTVDQKSAITPQVTYTVQRSKGGTGAWTDLALDTENWLVETVITPAVPAVAAQPDALPPVLASDYIPAKSSIKVSSTTATAPPDSATDIYRVKITQR